MSEWLSENWLVLVCAVLYVVINGTSITAAWKRRLKTVMKALETNSAVEGLGKGHVRRAGLKGDVILDSILDGIQPKTEKRVPVWKKILRGALKFVPFLIR